ncbi:MAG: DUF3068 domain-containing protein [Nocardioides sp.]
MGIGAFFLVTAVLCRVWGYPALAVAPIDQDSVTNLSATGATVFDTATLTEQTTDLSISAKTVGDIEASEEAGDDVRVWVSSSSTKDSDGNVRSRSIDRAAFDAFTAEAVNCCDEFTETEEGEPQEVAHEGLVFKFPFQTEKKTYDFWDGTLGETVPIEYVGEEEVDGLSTYKFEQTIEPTVTDTLEVPASVLGEEGEENLEAERTYSNHRTVWVEPVTGAVVNRNDQQLTTLRYDGTDRVTLTEADVSYTQESIEETADTVRTKALLLRVLNPIIPIGGLILGLILIGVGVFFIRRKPAAEPDMHDEGEPATATR